MNTDIKIGVEERQTLLLALTKKLVICMVVAVLLMLSFFFVHFSHASETRSLLTIIVFAMGIVGGLVSIQQRLHKLSNEELQRLSQSWASVLLIPIYGGVFALILHVIFLAQLIQCAVFPVYISPEFSNPPEQEGSKEGKGSNT